MHTQWIEQRTVQRVSLREGLVLSLDDYNELVIARPMRLTLPAIGSHPSEEVLIDPARVSAQERPLLDLAGAVCTRAWCDDEGGRCIWASPAGIASMSIPTARDGVGAVRQTAWLHGLPPAWTCARRSP